MKVEVGDRLNLLSYIVTSDKTKSNTFSGLFAFVAAVLEFLISESIAIYSRTASPKEIHLRSFQLPIVIGSGGTPAALHIFLGSNKSGFYFERLVIIKITTTSKALFITRVIVPVERNNFGNIWTGNGGCRKHIGNDDRIYRDGLLRESSYLILVVGLSEIHSTCPRM